MNEIQGAIDQIGHRALTESLVVKHIHPLFSNVLKNTGDKIYLANHSLGRPLDQTVIDVQSATEIWYQKLDDAWDDWLSRMNEFRKQIADLIHAPNADCIVPKNSAGQGLRTIRNCFDEKLDVVTTQDEFTSIDVILKNYYQRGRIDLKRMSPDEDRCYRMPAIKGSLQRSGQLLVISLVMFTTGQLLTELEELIAEVHKHDGKVLVDLYRLRPI